METNGVSVFNKAGLQKMRSGTGKARKQLQQEQDDDELGQTGLIHGSNRTGNRKNTALLYLFFAAAFTLVPVNLLYSYQATFPIFSLFAVPIFYNFRPPTAGHAHRCYVSPRQGSITYLLVVMGMVLPASAAEDTANMGLQPSAAELSNRQSAGLLDYIVTALILAVLAGWYLIKETDLAARIKASSFWSKSMYWAPLVLFITILNLVVVSDETTSLVIWVG